MLCYAMLCYTILFLVLLVLESSMSKIAQLDPFTSNSNTVPKSLGTSNKESEMKSDKLVTAKKIELL